MFQFSDIKYFLKEKWQWHLVKHIFLPKWHLTKKQVSPVSKPCVLLNSSSALAALPCKPPGAGDHLASGFLYAETEVLMPMGILRPHAFKHAFRGLMYQIIIHISIPSGCAPTRHFSRKKGFREGKSLEYEGLALVAGSERDQLMYASSPGAFCS